MASSSNSAFNRSRSVFRECRNLAKLYTSRTHNNRGRRIMGCEKFRVCGCGCMMLLLSVRERDVIPCLLNKLVSKDEELRYKEEELWWQGRRITFDGWEGEKQRKGLL